MLEFITAVTPVANSSAAFRPNDVQAALAEGGAGTTDIENEALARFVLSESNTSAPPDSLPGDEEKRAKHLKPAGAQQPNLDFQPQGKYSLSCAWILKNKFTIFSKSKILTSRCRCNIIYDKDPGAK